MSVLYLTNTAMYMSQEEKNWKDMYQNISNTYIGVVELLYFLLVSVCSNDPQ